MSYHPTGAKEKTKEQIAKERRFLSRIKLCEWNLFNGCNPPNGGPCNFAHFLIDLQMPEEEGPMWSTVWQEGHVDMVIWDDYEPNERSKSRFRRQFEWECKHCPDLILNWVGDMRGSSV